uniref:Neprosin PEP catalytic domain-containing protein n=1 Tax=Cannabis sativa TaxID=3483 RepID=A0A803PXP4_CANSA
MRPSSRPKGAMNENKPTNKERHVSIKSQFKSKRCPSGTVPIRRMTKEDLIKAKLFTKAHSSRISSLTSKNAGVHQSIVHTKPDPKKKYNGGGTTASFFTLDNVSGSQYSKGQMKIQNGNDFIQVGWTDQVTGNWWLELGNKYNEIGYWPSKIFSDGGLKDLATYVEWGGETYSPPGLLGPPMGSGWLLKGNTADDAYCKFLTTINEAHKTEEDATNTLKYSVDVDFYEVEDWGFRSELRHIMTYGGPGPK